MVQVTQIRENRLELTDGDGDARLTTATVEEDKVELTVRRLPRGKDVAVVISREDLKALVRGV